jgi:hypothetical protein
MCYLGGGEMSKAAMEAARALLTGMPFFATETTIRLGAEIIDSHFAGLVHQAQEALLQIEYMEDKFDAGTSTGEAVKSRIRTELEKVK